MIDVQAVKDWLEEHGWYQYKGILKPKDIDADCVGAAVSAVTGDQFSWLKLNQFCRNRHGISLVAYNDATTTTYEDILILLEEFGRTQNED